MAKRQGSMGWAIRHLTQIHPLQTRRKVESFLERHTKNRNEVTLLSFSPRWRVGVNRIQESGGIVQEANALGKAKRYADVNTVVWMVKVQLGVNTL
jgi:bifunctional N-acetylglucosamine-1-phosphate-uridyltransferase/glucosamine-1-phosphate-acetyltransferase GlmU-like protein